MKNSLAGGLRFHHLLVVGWYITAVICWGGLLVSLMGYAEWFVRQPIRLHFNLPQILMTTASGLASAFSAIISLGLATVIFRRRPNDRAALFVSYFLLVYGFVMSGPFEMAEFLFLGQSGVYSYRVQGIIFTPLIMLLLLTFPNGTLTPPRVRWLIPFIVLLTLLLAVMPIVDIVSINSWRSQLLYTMIIIVFLTALGSQVYRYLRKSTPVERQQTKIVVYGIGLQFVFLTVSSIFFLQKPLEVQNAMSPQSLEQDLFWFVSIILLPIALTLAVVRSHLWDIDVVIRRTLIYGFLSAALFLLYFGIVILLQYVFRVVAGHESPAAIVISTLAIAGLFNPLLRSIQAVIDRRFYRSKYNSEQALARFQHSLRDRVDLDQVENELTGIVQTTIQPEWMTVWMRGAGEEGSAGEKR